MLHFHKDSSYASSHRGAGGRPPGLSESLTPYSGALLTPNPLSESCLRLVPRCVWKVGFHSSPRQQHLTQNGDMPPHPAPGFHPQQRVKGAQRHEQSEVAFLFPRGAFGRAEVLCWIKAAAAEYPGLSGQGKTLHMRQLRVKLPGEGPSSQPSFSDQHHILRPEGWYPSQS